MSSDIYIGQTFDGGRFRLVEHLAGKAYRRLYLARSEAEPSAHYLASLVDIVRPISSSQLHDELLRATAANFELMHVGHCDVTSTDIGDKAFQEQTWAMIERAPEGTWLPRLTSAALAPAVAIQLAISVGRLMFDVERDNVIRAVRPECIWAVARAKALRAVGWSTRYLALFRHQHPHSTRVMFPRSYEVPETTLDERALTFKLATMLAEWCGGAFPFPESWANAPGQDLLRGEAKITAPKELEDLLRRAFIVDPAQRPSLSQFLDELAGLPA